ncbi:MAG: cyanophycinase [Candidatus Acidiferrales bacterium]
MNRLRELALISAAVLLAVATAAQSKVISPVPYHYFRVGNSANVRVSPRSGFALIGGGKDLDAAFQWLCERSRGGDFLILRASGTDAYNAYIQSLYHENSVATLVIPTRQAAMDPFVERAVDGAAAIFIAGGDQSNYINFWSGTPVERAINRAIRRGVPVGGTSAGFAVLGEFAYSAQNDSSNGPNLNSPAALADPFNRQVVTVRNFLAIPALSGIITDTHFHERDRLGRLLVFMATILQSGNVKRIRGIGIDQHTAFLLDPDGQGVVAGTGAVYFFEASKMPAVCRPGTPLTFAGISVRKLVSGGRFNVKAWSGDGVRYMLSVDSGAVRSTQLGGAIY